MVYYHLVLCHYWSWWSSGCRPGRGIWQYVYLAGVSGNMCTWTVIQTISYILRNGSNVYCCMIDMLKAFELVRLSLLFKKLIKSGLSLIFVRLLLFIYVNQYANVRWNGKFSSIFNIRNGVRQGAVLSWFSIVFTWTVFVNSWGRVVVVAG